MGKYKTKIGFLQEDKTLTWNKMKVVIVSKNPFLPGGISNFYRIFLRNYSHDDIQIRLFVEGVNKEQWEITRREYITFYFKNILSFIKLLCNDKYIKIVQLNPSLIPVPIVRDSIYILLSKLFKKKVIVFFHGWDYKTQMIIEKNSILQAIFAKIYSKADVTLVLSNEFKGFLQNMGFKNVIVTKTTFDGSLYKDRSIVKNKIPQLVFLGRLQREKGIFELLEAINILKNEGHKFVVNFIGWFPNENIEKEFMQFISKKNIDDKCRLLGYLEGEEKVKRLSRCDILVHPSWSEGCPTAVIEALAAGLFIIATDLPAIKEIITDGENGYVVKVKNSKDLADKIRVALINLNRINDVRQKNKKHAFSQYESKVIINQFHNIYKELLMEDDGHGKKSCNDIPF